MINAECVYGMGHVTAINRFPPPRINDVLTPGACQALLTYIYIYIYIIYIYIYIYIYVYFPAEEHTNGAITSHSVMTAPPNAPQLSLKLNLCCGGGRSQQWHSETPRGALI